MRRRNIIITKERSFLSEKGFTSLSQKKRVKGGGRREGTLAIST